MINTRTTALTSLLALAVACGGSSSDEGSSPTEQGNFTLAQSNLPRDTAPAVAASELAELSAGNRAFAFDLYAELAQDPGNLFFSPHSISAALAMTYAGARGQTEAEMAATLHFTLSQAALHPAFNQLDLALESRADATPPQDLPDGMPPRLDIANSIWGQRGYQFEQPFLDTLAVSYGAGLRLLDFGANPDGARQTINQWVSDQTEARIPELLGEGTITPIIRLVLTNAIYFFANWRNPFAPEATAPGTFLADGTTEVTVDMMYDISFYDFVAGDGYAAISLPYVGDDLSMLLIVPDADRFAEVEAQLSADWLDTVVGSLGNQNVELQLPKWEFESKFRLAQTLQALGMTSAFDAGAADFSGMTSVEQLWIADVIHQAYVAVDEEGTEAAAATAVLMSGSSAPPEPVALTVDRPFIFLIRDQPTGAVLFAGRVTDPS